MHGRELSISFTLLVITVGRQIAIVDWVYRQVHLILPVLDLWQSWGGKWQATLHNNIRYWSYCGL